MTPLRRNLLRNRAFPTLLLLLFVVPPLDDDDGDDDGPPPGSQLSPPGDDWCDDGVDAMLFVVLSSALPELLSTGVDGALFWT